MKAVELCQVRPNGLLTFWEFENHYRGGTFHTRTGLMDEQKKRRFARYASLLLFLSSVKVNTTEDGREFKWRLNFLTLTLPEDPRKGDAVNKAVNLCFQKLRNHGFRHYVWRKEKQPGTGRLHWHLIGCHYVDKWDLNEFWNSSIQLHCPGMMRAVCRKLHTYRPPSTDIVAVYNERGAMKDLKKYLQDCDRVDGNSFGVSQDLAQIKFVTVEANCAHLERSFGLSKPKSIKEDLSYFHYLPNWLLMRSLKEPLKSEVKAWRTENQLS